MGEKYASLKGVNITQCVKKNRCNILWCMIIILYLQKEKVDCCSMSICSVNLKCFYVAILTIDKRYPCYMIGY